MKEIFISRFSPNRTAPEKLEAITVQREEMIDETVDKVSTSVLTKNKHHMVFIGPRGAGKTHLLSLVNHRIINDSKLSKKMFAAWLNEDETSPSFLSLMIRIYRSLSISYPERFKQDELEKIFDAGDPDLAVELISQLMLDLVGKKTVVVLLENLDALFRDFSNHEQKRWRAFLQNNPQVFSTVATAQRLSEAFSSQDSPFFGFFNVTHLKPFTVDEAKELLMKIAALKEDVELKEFLETPRGRSRVRALHHLTGGNQRLFIILSEFANRETLDDLVGPFEELADEQLTPYYQERLRWLSTQQRSIVEFLCKVTKPTAVKEIARQLFVPHGTVTGQLKHLREMGYVVANKRGKESLYELAEPLMRLSYQIKETKGKSPLRILVDFLRIWYERDELEKLSRDDGDSSSYLLEALRLYEKEGDLRIDILRNCSADIDNMEYTDEELNTFEDLFSETKSVKDAENYMKSLCYRPDQKERYFDFLKKNPALQKPKIDSFFCLMDLGLNNAKSIDDRFFTNDNKNHYKAVTFSTYSRVLSTAVKSEEDWKNVINLAEKALQNLPGIAFSFHDLIECYNHVITVFRKEEAVEKIEGLIRLYAKYKALNHIGNTILNKEFILNLSSGKGADLLSLLKKWANQFKEIDMPLRVVEVIVKYLKSNHDSRFLLDLPLEERKIAEELISENF